MKLRVTMLMLSKPGPINCCSLLTRWQDEQA